MNKFQFPRRGVYLLFDPLKWKKKPWEKTLEEVFPFVCAVQLRSPSMSLEETEDTAAILRNITLRAGVPLIINNFPGIAAGCRADGVHLGKEDMSVSRAKKVFSGIIGVSRHNQHGADEAVEEGASYIGAGPVFATETKDTGRKTLGPEGFSKIKKSSPIPVIPVGGINPSNRRLLYGISDIVAVSSAINSSPDPGKTVNLLV